MASWQTLCPSVGSRRILFWEDIDVCNNFESNPSSSYRKKSLRTIKMSPVGGAAPPPDYILLLQKLTRMWTWPLSFNVKPSVINSNSNWYQLVANRWDTAVCFSFEMSYTDTHFCTFTHSHTSTYSSVFGRHVFLLLFHPSSSAACLPLPGCKSSPNTFSMLCDRVTTSGQGRSLLRYQREAPEATIRSSFYYYFQYVRLRPGFITGVILWFSSFLSHPETVTLWLKQPGDPVRLRFSCFSAIISTLLDCFYLSSQCSWG